VRSVVNVGRKRAQEGQPKNLKGLGAFRFDFYYKSLFFSLFWF